MPSLFGCSRGSPPASVCRKSRKVPRALPDHFDLFINTFRRVRRYHCRDQSGQHTICIVVSGTKKHVRQDIGSLVLKSLHVGGAVNEQKRLGAHLAYTYLPHRKHQLGLIERRLVLGLLWEHIAWTSDQWGQQRFHYRSSGKGSHSSAHLLEGPRAVIWHLRTIEGLNATWSLVGYRYYRCYRA